MLGQALENGLLHLTHATYGLHPKMVPYNAIPNVTPNVTPNTTCDVPLSCTSETMKQRS